jgi:hypothetical protein
MQNSIRSRVGTRVSWPMPMLIVAALSIAPTEALLANPSVHGATSQITPGTTNDQASPASVITSPDFRALMKIMHRNIVACGGPHTAVLHWYVSAEGLIDNFVLNKSSGDACFDEVVTLNAEAVVKAKLLATPAVRFGIPEAAWIPFAVAARD